MGETAGEGTSAEMEFTTMVVSYRCSQYNAISEIAYPEDLPTEETSGEGAGGPSRMKRLTRRKFPKQVKMSLSLRLARWWRVQQVLLQRSWA